jgi:hypothetical protein
VQGALALTLLLSGKWLAGLGHLALLAYMVHLWAGNKVYIDTTDAFRQLPALKTQRLAMLAAHTALFMLIVYRCVGLCVSCVLLQCFLFVDKAIFHTFHTQYTHDHTKRTCRLIETAIHTLLTPEGRAMTQRLLREAAVSVHGY